MKRVLGWAICLVVPLILIPTAHAELITGRILGPDGAPAVKAQAWVQNREGEATGQYVELPLDGAGAFQVELKATAYSPNFFGRILIFQSGFAPGGGGLKRGENIFRLQPALPLKGRVLTEQNQPVAGVKVGLRFLSGSGDTGSQQYFALQGTPAEERFSAVSDANGAWEIDAGIKGGRGYVAVQDPRFMHLGVNTSPGQEATVRLRPGVTLSGRVVHEDGKPATGVTIWAQAQGYAQNTVSWGEGKSGDDGRFQLAGLSEIPYNIVVDVPDREWVAVALEGVNGRSSQTQPLPDMVLIKGALLEGTVTDEKGAPIAGVAIGCYGPNRPASGAAVSSATSDEKGFYRLRVAPGKNRIYVMGKPAEFLYPKTASPSQNLDLQIKNGETKNMPFVLERGLTVEGRVQDRAGAPAENVMLSLTRITDNNPGYQYNAPVSSDKNGVWKAVGLVPGKWKVEAQGEWETVPPVEIDVPRAAELLVRVQPVEYSVLHGRVVSFTGQAVGDVQLTFSITSPEGRYYSMSQRSVISNAQGDYEIDKLKRSTKVAFFSASKPGFQFSKGGLFLKGTGGGDFSDIVMVAQSARLAGRVLDVQKQPVANARVISPDADPPAQAITDAGGKFQLENLAQGFVEIIALHPEKGVATTRQISDGSDIVLQLVPGAPFPAQDMARAEEVLREALQYAPGSQSSAGWATLLPYDFERAVQLASNAEGTLPEGFLIRALLFLGRHDPAKAMQWGVGRLDEFENTAMRNYAMARLGLAIADENPQMARELYERLRTTDPGEGYAAKLYLVYQAQLAARLKLPEARALVDEALAAGEKESKNENENRGYVAMVAEALAQADSVEARRIIEKLQGNEKSNALQRVIAVLVRRGGLEDIKTARELLEAGEDGGQELRFGFSGGAVKLIPVLGQSDPAAALALARRITEPYYKVQALTAAALFQEETTMREVLREAAAAALNHQAPIARLAQVAILAHPKFPDLSREFTEKALRLYRERENTNEPGQIAGREDDVQNLAIALSQSDKMAAREFLEVEWIKLERIAKNDYVQNRKRQGIVYGMANVDFGRALQMSRAIPERADGSNLRYDVLRQLARWILTPSEKRPSLWLVDRFGSEEELD